MRRFLRELKELNFLKRNSKYIKVAITVLVILLFALYVSQNAEEFRRLRSVSLNTVFQVILGQSIVILANILILRAFSEHGREKTALKDATEIVAYSSLINFFGFLQAGVGLRAVYLRKKIGMNYRKYFALTLYQFTSLFSFSLIAISIGYFANSITPLNLITLMMILLSAIIIVCLLIYSSKKVRTLLGALRNEKKVLVKISIFVLLQLVGSYIAYRAELASVQANTNLSAMLIFTGISQFSIVLAITPGAIGIREGLLYLVAQQMMITGDDIVIAATIDRALYCITLAIFAPAAVLARRKYSVILDNDDQ